MPEGAYLEELNNISKFRDYIDLHGEDWYKFVNGTCGREVPNGSLRLVIGVLKTSSWGIAIFSNVLRQMFRLEFRVNSRYDEHGQVAQGNMYNWDHFGTAEVRTGPGPGENDGLVSDPALNPLRNQCLFLRTINVKLSDSVWEQLHPRPPVEVKVDAKPGSSGTGHSSSQGTFSKPSSTSTPKSFSSAAFGGATRRSQPIEAVSQEQSSRVNTFMTPSSSYLVSRNCPCLTSSC